MQRAVLHTAQSRSRPWWTVIDGMLYNICSFKYDVSYYIIDFCVDEYMLHITHNIVATAYNGRR